MNSANLCPPVSGLHLQALSQESANFLKLFKNPPKNFFFNQDHQLVNSLGKIEAVEITNLIRHCYLDALQNDQLQDPMQFLNRLAGLIPLQKLKENPNDILQEAKNMLEVAKIYLKATEKVSKSILEHLSTILDGFISIIESFISVYGIASLLKPTENDFEAASKAHKISALFHLFGLFSTAIVVWVPAKSAGTLIGSILFTMTGLSLLWSSIQPVPKYLPGYPRCLSLKAKDNQLIASVRKETLDEMAEILRMGRHVILVGSSRKGKTKLLQAFDLAIQRGDYPDLKLKRTFSYNTGDLLGKQTSNQESGNNILNKISTSMGKHSDAILIGLDEAHMACKNKEKLADQLKSYLDEGGEFAHVVALTTDKEYENVKNNEAFALRFDKIEVTNTDEYETMQVISETVLKSHPRPIIQGKALDAIYKYATRDSDAPQPTTAIHLLKKCINCTGRTQKSKTEKLVSKKNKEILAIKLKAAASGEKVSDQIKKIESELIDLNAKLKEEKATLEKLYKTKELYDTVRRDLYRTVLKVASVSEKTFSVQTEKDLKMFFLLDELSTLLVEYIQDQTKNSSTRFIIDENLVSQIAGQ